MPDDPIVIERVPFRKPITGRKGGPNDARSLLSIASALFGLLLITGCGSSSSDGPEVAERPECGHDSEPETIAGQYTPVPEYHDCQRLVIDSSGHLVFGRKVAVFLSKEVIEGRFSITRVRIRPGTPAIDTTPEIIPDLGIPSVAVDQGGSAQIPRGPITLPLRLAGADSADLGTATGYVVIPWVQVVADSAYGPLGIKRGFNCLYFTAFTGSDGRPLLLDAKMVFQHEEEYRDCNEPEYMSAPGTPLKMSRNGEGSTPTVTRWDWSETDRSHVIGVPCPTSTVVSPSGPPSGGTPPRGTAPAKGGGAVVPAAVTRWTPKEWCDVGSMTATGSAPHGLTPAVRAIKGWSDEQYLADPSATGPVRTDVLGTVFPAPGLDLRTVESYSKGFVTVAHVALRVPTGDALAVQALQRYADRFGFHEVSPRQHFDQMATIALCYGTAATCRIPEEAKQCTSEKSAGLADQPTKLPWWARTRSADSTVTKYHCVIYRGHDKGFKIPGVVRWRWHPNPGETNWISCPEGCCEVEG